MILETPNELAGYAEEIRLLRALAEEYPNDSIVVVTHGLFARNLIAAHLKCSYKEVPPLENAEVRLLEGVS